MGRFRRGDCISPPVTTRSSGAKVNGKAERTRQEKKAVVLPALTLGPKYEATAPGSFQ